MAHPLAKITLLSLAFEECDVVDLSYFEGLNTSLPLVEQLVYIRVHHSASHPRLNSGGVHWERVLKSLHPKANLRGTPSERFDSKALNLTVMPLVDALLSPSAISLVIPNMIKECVHIHSEELTPDSGSAKGIRAIGTALSMGFKDSFDRKLYRPIPGSAFFEWKTETRTINSAPMIQTPRAGSGAWTVVVVFDECLSPADAATARNTIGPHQRPEVRYAFYTTLNTGMTQFLDAEGFFQATASPELQGTELAEAWQSRMKELEAHANARDREEDGQWESGKVVPPSA